MYSFVDVRTIFSSPYAILQRGPYSISLCRLVFPVTKIQRQKYNFFPLVHILHPTQQAYMQAAPLQPAYIEICARKSKLNVGFPCHDKISLILGLPYNGNVPNRPLSFIFKSIKKPISSCGKGERIQL
jgi:hypothetical protein